MSKHSSYVSALSPEYVLLGLLELNPSHGYDLHKHLAHDLGQVWHIRQSQLYTILNRLEAQGDIRSERKTQPGAPDRRIFHITAQGHSRFKNWLESPTGCSVRALRVEFITRLYFISQQESNDLVTVIKKQIDVTSQCLETLNSVKSQSTPDQIFNQLGLEFRARQLNAALVWLQDIQNIFEKRAIHE